MGGTRLLFLFNPLLFYQTKIAMSTDQNQPILHNEVLTVREVATYLRVNRVTVWRWCTKGVIPATRVGRTWRIHRDDVLNLFNLTTPSDSDIT